MQNLQINNFLISFFYKERNETLHASSNSDAEPTLMSSKMLLMYYVHDTFVSHGIN